MRIPPLLLAALLFSACGPGEKLAVATLIHEVNGLEEVSALGAVLVVDGQGRTGEAALDSVGLSSSFAPLGPHPLNVCRIVTLEGEDGTAGGDPGWRLLDPGGARIKGDTTELSLDAVDLSPLGTAYLKTAPEAELPYGPGEVYTIESNGSGEAPSFAAAMAAPPAFDLERLGFGTPGPGTLSVSTRADLDVLWAPAAEDTELYVFIRSGRTGLTCRIWDTGSFEIEKSLIAQLPLGAATFAVERFVEGRFETASGADGRVLPGRMRIGYRRTYRIELQ